MENKDIPEKLQKAYHSMLEHVEELIDKDKKPLKEAFTEAEEKLSEWRELSREEIDHISTELKANLQDLGEASNTLRESLRETLQFDTAYLANSLWGKLAKVADKTKIELAEFSESLQKHTVAGETTYSDQQQHWLDDAKQWQRGFETSLDQLDEARKLLRQQIRSINTYSKSVINSEADQSRHDLLAQMNQETTQTITDFHQRIVATTAINERNSS